VKLQNQLYETVRKDAHRVARYCKNVSPDFDEENIHKLRTTVKKLRALLRWQEADDTVFTGWFKDLYHACGDIRDGQVLCARLAKENIVLPGFSSWLADHTEKAKERWDSIYSNDQVHEWEKNMPTRSHLIKSDSQDFYRTNLEKFSFGSTVVTDNRIHDIRKAAKDILYVAQWVAKHDTHSKTLHPAIPEIASRAGEYIDEVNSLRLLRTYLQEEKNPQAIEAGTALRKAGFKRKRDKKQKLLHLIVAFHGANG
jgi:CHAD domain-containing protein